MNCWYARGCAGGHRRPGSAIGWTPSSRPNGENGTAPLGATCRQCDRGSGRDGTGGGQEPPRCPPRAGTRTRAAWAEGGARTPGNRLWPTWQRLRLRRLAGGDRGHPDRQLWPTHRSQLGGLPGAVEAWIPPEVERVYGIVDNL